jgi:perosamine synthetase
MNKALEIKILNQLNTFLKKKIAYPLHEPYFDKNDAKAVSKAFSSTYVSTVGPSIKSFEKAIAKYCGSKYAVATNSGTSAIHISLLTLGIKRKDEILVPAFTFVGTINAIMYSSAIPHFVDSSIEKKGIDIDKLDLYLKKIIKRKGKYIYNKNTGNRIGAIMPVHVFGHPCQIDKVIALGKKYNLPIIEDAAESLGSKYKKKHCGTFGALGCLSFNGNKIITTGSGGVILTNNKNMAKKAKHLSMVAKKKHRWLFIHDEVGFNYKLTNLNAAIGITQLKKIEKFISTKRKLFKIYKKIFSPLKNYLSIMDEPISAKSNFWLQNLILKKPNLLSRNKILKKLNDNKIFARPAWNLISDLKPYKKYPKMDLKGSKIFLNSIISLPSSQKIILSRLNKLKNL